MVTGTLSSCKMDTLIGHRAIVRKRKDAADSAFWQQNYLIRSGSRAGSSQTKEFTMIRTPVIAQTLTGSLKELSDENSDSDGSAWLTR